MNEDTQLWLALLKEWLDELDCTDVVEHATGFNFMYHEMKVRVWLKETICIQVAQYRDIYIARRGSVGFRISGFDICNPDTTPSERFQVLKFYLDAWVLRSTPVPGQRQFPQ